MHARIGALVVTHNFDSDFHSLINSIRSQTEKILIVDNYSKISCRSELKGLAESDSHSIEIEFLASNKGLPYAYNYGLQRLFSDGFTHALLLDQDSILHRDYVSTIMRFSNENGRAIYCGNYRRANTNLETFYDYFHRWRFERKQIFVDGLLEVSHAISSGTILTKEIFEEVGPFVEEMFIDYVDIEYCLRAKEIGIPTRIVENATFHHSLGYTTVKRFLGKQVTSSGYSPFRLFHICRNRIWCWKRFTHLPSFLIHDFRLLIGYLIRMTYVETGLGSKLWAILKGITIGCITPSPIPKRKNSLSPT